MTSVDSHEEWMRRALQLACLGSGHVAPNPLVGCVIVRDGIAIAEGYHARYGDLHAETDALRHIGGSAVDATMYVNLEPCTHHGKQPPCVDAIIKSGVSRVVIGMTDPNPVVSGRGIEILRSSGIDVITDVLREEAEHTNRHFSHWIQTGRPHVTLQIATSLDARAEMPADQPRFITGAGSRFHVHKMRAHLDAVMIGVGTAVRDNPELTVRLSTGRNPVRIIVDPSCRLPTSTALVQTARETRTIVVCSEHASVAEQQALRDHGIAVVALPTDDGMVISSDSLMKVLASIGITSILVEGGPYLAGRLLRDDAVDELHIHTAPIMIGSGPTWTWDMNFRRWQLRDLRLVGSDTHVQYVRIR